MSMRCLSRCRREVDEVLEMSGWGAQESESLFSSLSEAQLHLTWRPGACQQRDPHDPLARLLMAVRHARPADACVHVFTTRTMSASLMINASRAPPIHRQLLIIVAVFTSANITSSSSSSAAATLHVVLGRGQHLTQLVDTTRGARLNGSRPPAIAQSPPKSAFENTCQSIHAYFSLSRLPQH